MKKIKLFLLCFVLILILSSCSDTVYNKKSQTKSTKETVQNSTTQREIKGAWPESNPEIEKNCNLILNAFPENIFTEHRIEAVAQRVACNVAEGLAGFFYWIGIPELKEVEVLSVEEDYYLVRFVDINDEIYRVNVDKRHGGGPTWTVWKEGEEHPVFQKIN